MKINQIGITEARDLLIELHEAGRTWAETGDDAEVVKALDQLDRYFGPVKIVREPEDYDYSHPEHKRRMEEVRADQMIHE